MQSGMATGRGRGSRGGATTSSQTMQTSHVGQPQARVYAITRQEAPFAPNVVTGILSVYGHDAYILIDPGSTCSFISYEFALRVHSDITSLGYDIYVSMLADDVVLVNTIVKDCVVVMGDVSLKVNLVVINLRDFDVILGMDCLSQNHAVIDCQTKEVSMEILGHRKIVMVGERKMVPNCLVSALKAF